MGDQVGVWLLATDAMAPSQQLRRDDKYVDRTKNRTDRRKMFQKDSPNISMLCGVRIPCLTHPTNAWPRNKHCIDPVDQEFPDKQDLGIDHLM